MKPTTLLFFVAMIGISVADEFSQWTWRVPNPPNILFRRVVFAQDQFVAVGDVGTIMTSTNGWRWILRNSGTPHRLQNILHSDHYVASGDGGAVVVSPTAENWTAAAFPSTNKVAALDFGNDIYLALDHRGNFFRSENALDWATVSVPAPTGGTDMVFGEGLFVAVGPLGMILTSTNGVDWAEQNSGTSGAIFSVAYGEGRFVAVGADTGTLGIILTSDDGVSWFLQLVPKPLEDVTFGDGRFVIVGGGAYDESGTSLTSDDGIYFDSPADDNGLGPGAHGVACGNGICVVVGVGVHVSDDGGNSWTNVNSGPLETMYSFAQRDGTLVGVGGNGTILTNLGRR
jgi:hypothetical protein